MAATIAIILVIAGLFGAIIYSIARPSPYANMTEEEFEQDAKRGSYLGSVVLGMERVLRRKEADYIITAKERVEKHSSPAAGDPPEDFPARPPAKPDSNR